jgi:hypothetical protein
MGQPENNEQSPRRLFGLSFEALSLIFDGIIAVAAIVGSIFVYRQLVAVEDQLGVMRDQLRDARKAGVESDKVTNQQLQIAANQAMSQQYTSIAALVSAMNQMKLANAARDSAIGTAQIAKASAESNLQAMETFRSDQRAKVEVQGGRGGKYLSGPSTQAYAGLTQLSNVHIDILFSNIGKTAATDVKLCSVIYLTAEGLGPVAFSQERSYESDCTAMMLATTEFTATDINGFIRNHGSAEGYVPVHQWSVPLIHAGEPWQVTMSWSGVNIIHGPRWHNFRDHLDSDELSGIRSDYMWLVIAVRLSYKDEFGRLHDTLYCGRWQPPSNDLIKLPYGNYSN